MALSSNWAFASVVAVGAAFSIAPAAAMGGGGSSMPTGSNSPNWPSHQAQKPSEYNDAVKLIKADKCSDAIPLLQKAIDKSPKDADIYNYLGYCQRKLGQYNDSFENYRKALELDPNHRGAREYVGELFLDLNRPDDAQSQLDQLTQLCPKGCVERDTLAKAIADYKANHPASASPPAPATPSSPPSPPAPSGN